MLIRYYEQMEVGNKRLFIADKKEADKFKELTGKKCLSPRLIKMMEHYGVDFQKVEKPK
jgi:hypothetical protein